MTPTSPRHRRSATGRQPSPCWIACLRACDEVQQSSDARRLAANASSRPALPLLADGTKAKQFLDASSADTTQAQIDEATKLACGSRQRVVGEAPRTRAIAGQRSQAPRRPTLPTRGPLEDSQVARREARGGRGRRGARRSLEGARQRRSELASGDAGVEQRTFDAEPLARRGVGDMARPLGGGAAVLDVRGVPRARVPRRRRTSSVCPLSAAVVAGWRGPTRLGSRPSFPTRPRATLTQPRRPVTQRRGGLAALSTAPSASHNRDQSVAGWRRGRGARSRAWITAADDGGHRRSRVDRRDAG